MNDNGIPFTSGRVFAKLSSTPFPSEYAGNLKFDNSLILQNSNSLALEGNDDDGDGVPNNKDLCSQTMIDTVVDETGCFQAHIIPAKYSKNDAPFLPTAPLYDFYRKEYTTLRQLALHLKNNPKLEVEFQTADVVDELSRGYHRLLSAVNYFIFKFNIDPDRIAMRAVPLQTANSDRHVYFIIRNSEGTEILREQGIGTGRAALTQYPAPADDLQFLMNATPVNPRGY